MHAQLEQCGRESKVIIIPELAVIIRVHTTLVWKFVNPKRNNKSLSGNVGCVLGWQQSQVFVVGVSTHKHNTTTTHPSTTTTQTSNTNTTKTTNNPTTHHSTNNNSSQTITTPTPHSANNNTHSQTINRQSTNNTSPT